MSDYTISIRKRDTREDLLKLQAFMATLPQLENEVEHYFAPGLYARQMTLRKDTYAIGKIHKTAHMTIMVSGDLEISTDEGMKRFVGFNVLHSKVGAKRAAHAFEDTILISFHPTHETDIDALEDELIEHEDVRIEQPFVALEVMP